MIASIFEFILSFDQHLKYFIQSFGWWTYLILFVIIFAETGLVITPFLPGDSLLFAVGAFAAAGSFDIVLVIVILAAAGIAGDSVNYAAGRYISDELFRKTLGKLVKQKHIDKTHKFYEKYGGKTIILARFVPIIRTFAPFVAGVGKMTYVKFITYNIAGGILWVCSITLAGYFFGNMPVIKNNFDKAILVIIFISILPAIVEYLRHHFKKTREK